MNLSGTAWGTSRIDHVATVNARIGWKALTAAEYQDTGYAFLSTPNIKSATIDFERVNFISRFRFDESPDLKLQKGDVLLAKDGSTLGIANVVRSLPRPATVNGSIAVIRPFAIDGRFLTYALRSAPIQGWIEQVKDGMGVPHLFQADIKKLRFPTPDLGEQRRIADFLDDHVSRIDNIISARRRSIELADASAEANRRAIVLGPSQQPTSLPWANEIGTDRRVRRLSQIARLGTGHTPSRSNEDYWVDCEIPWLTTADVHKFRYDQISALNETVFVISGVGLANSAAVLHPKGTVALSRTASAGFPIVMGKDMATSQDFATWTCGPELVPEFLLATLRVMRDYLLRFLSMGSTHKTIYFPDLESIRVVIPDASTQALAVRQLKKLDEDRITSKEMFTQQIALLAKYKQSLITAAVTGELDVTTASKRIPA